MKRELDENGYTNYIMVGLAVFLIIFLSVALLFATKGTPFKKENFVEVNVPLKGEEFNDRVRPVFNGEATTRIFSERLQMAKLSYIQPSDITVTLRYADGTPIDQEKIQTQVNDGEEQTKTFVLGPLPEPGTTVRITIQIVSYSEESDTTMTMNYADAGYDPIIFETPEVE